MKRPPAILGLHHLALQVRDLEACERFYVDLLGMTVEWRPDAENLYLSSGSDNLALHKVCGDTEFADGQRLDHMGFILSATESVDQWYDYLLKQGVTIVKSPRTHR
ncbi:MAG: VOC family protein, partial [Gammaproteobacteria bacterium]